MSLLKRTTANALQYGDVILKNGERMQVEFIERESFGATVEMRKEFGGTTSVFLPDNEPVILEL